MRMAWRRTDVQIGHPGGHAPSPWAPVKGLEGWDCSRRIESGKPGPLDAAWVLPEAQGHGLPGTCASLPGHHGRSQGRRALAR